MNKLCLVRRKYLCCEFIENLKQVISPLSLQSAISKVHAQKLISSRSINLRDHLNFRHRSRKMVDQIGPNDRNVSDWSTSRKKDGLVLNMVMILHLERQVAQLKLTNIIN